MLHLMYRLVVQPNASRAQSFAEAFMTCGGIETLLVLLQREAKAGDHNEPDLSFENDKTLPEGETDLDNRSGPLENSQGGNTGSVEENQLSPSDKAKLESSMVDRMSSVSEYLFIKNLGGITSSISAENARKNVYNADKSDGIVVGIINLLGALVISGHLKFGEHAPPDMTNNLLGLLEGGGTMFDDKVSLLLFALQKAFQAAPNRLMTGRVYTALLGASV